MALHKSDAGRLFGVIPAEAGAGIHVTGLYLFAVIPAKAGIHMNAVNALWWLREIRTSLRRWAPCLRRGGVRTFAGVTNKLNLPYLLSCLRRSGECLICSHAPVPH